MKRHLSTIILVRSCQAPADSIYPVLELEMSKEEWACQNLVVGERFFVSISPKDLLLLR